MCWYIYRLVLSAATAVPIISWEPPCDVEKLPWTTRPSL